MNITLIVPKTAPLPDWFKKYHILDRKQHNMPSLGLLSIAAYVENQGHNINVIDNSVEELNQEELVKCILKTEPGLVGFNTSFATYPEVRISSDSIGSVSVFVCIVGFIMAISSFRLVPFTIMDIGYLSIGSQVIPAM